MSQRLADGVRRFRRATYSRHREEYRRLVVDGQRPHTLFIGCSDARIVPHLLTDTGPGELFVVRNVGAFVPPHDADGTAHGVGAAVEFAVGRLGVADVVVCGHAPCGAIRALYDPPGPGASHLARWLATTSEARLGPDPRATGAGAAGDPASSAVSEETLRRTEERSVALQVECLAAYPVVRERMDAEELTLHGWHYDIGEGSVRALDRERGRFVPLPDR